MVLVIMLVSVFGARSSGVDNRSAEVRVLAGLDERIIGSVSRASPDGFRRTGSSRFQTKTGDITVEKTWRGFVATC